ncbi:signal peptidase I [Tessaracoccus caeni]|uniref:signal peptidase I n=1 Tax=Tessaracoccus caeni TaxID=3031239 RepID=UPI0023DA71A6|nr:signal peptidase I [Tessaracoccus caeni]MDF1489808.1 signal peptidase I [Tessaracoccus caeni]
MSETDTPKQRPSFGRRVLGWLAEGAIIVVGAVIIATLLRTFVGQMFLIPSGSMENTLLVNDRVLVLKFGGFDRGDVVVFEDPARWLSPQPRDPNVMRDALEFIGVLPNSSTEHLIKRVIGMPGDHVMLDAEGKIEVNGYPLDESAYLYTEAGVQVAPATVPFEIVVPADRLFVMGDHRNESNDSRCLLQDIRAGQPEGMAAFVPIDHVVGKSVAILAPLDRLASFKTPETFAGVPDAVDPAPDRPELIHVEDGC